ncbi:MAG: hypothetical protein ACR2MN_14445, partial [Acidimicrobiales bacterium]
EVDTLALPGRPPDSCVAAPAHVDVGGRLPLPADRHEALAIAVAMPVAPTMIVDTAHGLLIHHVFDHPMVMATDTERAKAKALSGRWNAHAVELGRTRGVHVDNVGDLARLRRVVGTVNRKGQPVPVRVVECHPGRRYRSEELAAALPAIPAPPPPPRGAGGPIRPARPDGRETPAEAFSRCVPWSSILEPAGFTLMREVGETGWWRHPAASSPVGTPSATTDHGAPVLVVFSESTAAVTGLPSGPGHRLTKFRVWSILNYAGDESAAARAIRAMAKVVAS